LSGGCRTQLPIFTKTRVGLKKIKNIVILHFFIVESDTKDNTTQELENESKKLNLRLVTLGKLKTPFLQELKD
jgi:hypothetical protein